jgi:hypothetical protein
LLQVIVDALLRVVSEQNRNADRGAGRSEAERPDQDRFGGEEIVGFLDVDVG